MPWFRCGGGTSLKVLAHENVLNNLRIAVGNQVNLSASIGTDQLGNAFGWSNSTATVLAFYSLNGLTNLGNFFTKYGYTVSFPRLRIGDEHYDNWAYILQIVTGDPDDPHYPGHETGETNISLMSLRFNHDESYINSLTKYDRYQILDLLEITGNQRDFNFTFGATRDSDRWAKSISSNTWIINLLEDAGYTITHGTTVEERWHRQNDTKNSPSRNIWVARGNL